MLNLSYDFIVDAVYSRNKSNIYYQFFQREEHTSQGFLVYGKPPSRNTQLKKDPDQFVANPEGPRGLLLEPDDEVHARHRYPASR